MYMHIDLEKERDNLATNGWYKVSGAVAPELDRLLR